MANTGDEKEKDKSMETLLTNLSSLLAFLQQHFMPPFIFISLNAFFFRSWLEKIGVLPADIFAKLGLFFITSLVIAYALDNLNVFIHDFFQGHTIKDRWLGKLLIGRHRERLGSVTNRLAAAIRIKSLGRNSRGRRKYQE